MKKAEPTEREYVERIIGMTHTGAIRRILRRAFGFGVIAGLLLLLIAGGTLFAYSRMGGSTDNWHFVFGFVIGTLLCPAIVTFGISLARVLTDISSKESRPFTLMVKYHDHLIREGLNPYEESKS